MSLKKLSNFISTKSKYKPENIDGLNQWIYPYDPLQMTLEDGNRVIGANDKSGNANSLYQISGTWNRPYYAVKQYVENNVIDCQYDSESNPVGLKGDNLNIINNANVIYLFIIAKVLNSLDKQSLFSISSHAGWNPRFQCGLVKDGSNIYPYVTGKRLDEEVAITSTSTTPFVVGSWALFEYKLKFSNPVQAQIIINGTEYLNTVPFFSEGLTSNTTCLRTELNIAIDAQAQVKYGELCLYKRLTEISALDLTRLRNYMIKT